MAGLHPLLGNIVDISGRMAEAVSKYRVDTEVYPYGNLYLSYDAGFQLQDICLFLNIGVLR